VLAKQSATWARIDVRGADGKRALPGIYLN
jgi:hypothetical protein